MSTAAPVSAARKDSLVSTSSTPTDPGDRIQALDIIRGIAVFGLAWVHLTGEGAIVSTLDQAAAWTMWILAEKKFQAMFALLLGISLALQIDRAAAENEPVAGRWLRRMLALYAIGWGTAVFISHGEILRSYAVAGVVLLAFHRWRPRALLAAAALFLVLWISGPSLSTAAVRLSGGDVAASAQAIPEAVRAARSEGLAAFRQAVASGRYLDLTAGRAQMVTAMMRVELSSPPLGPLNLIPLNILAFVLLGLYAGRMRLVQERERRLPLLRRIAWIGIGVGLPLNVFGYWVLLGSPPAWLREPAVLGLEYQWLALYPGSVALGSGYLAALLLILTASRWRGRLQGLGAVGRMGFTNYLVNLLLITTLVFTLGLQGTFGRFAGSLLALAFFGLQIAYSRWWLARFRFGPVEWLWRALSYGRRPLMRVSKADSPTARRDLTPRVPEMG